MCDMIDEESQRRGAICLMLSFGEDLGRLDFGLQTKIVAHMSNLPIRINAFHLCTDNPNLKALKAFRSIFLDIIERSVRARVRFHFGKCVELVLKMVALYLSFLSNLSFLGFSRNIP